MVLDKQLDESSTLPVWIQPVNQRSTPGLIAEMIRNAIAAGEFEPGTQLREGQLAEQFVVSRGPLREAFQRLIQEGLLRSEPNRGVFVQDLDGERIADIYLVRTALERSAGEVIIANSDAGAMDKLQGLVEAMADAEQQGDQQRLIRYDLEFHETLVAASNSDHLQRLFSTLIYEVGMCLAALGSASHHRRPQVTTEHREILVAIKEGDPARLANAVTVHSNSAVATLQAALEANGRSTAAGE